MSAVYAPSMVRVVTDTQPSEEQPAAAAPEVPLSGRRRAAVWTLIVLATLIGLGSALSSWVNRGLLDNTAWNKASAKLIQDQQVRSSLSVYLVNQLYDNVDVAGQLQQALPPKLRPLAAPVADALRQPASSAVDFLLARPRAQNLFVAASSAAHEKLVNVLENKTGSGVSTGNGNVTVDLSVLLTQLGKDLGVSNNVLAKLPPGAGTFTVMRSDQLSTAQAAVQGVKVLSTWLLALVLGMFALAVYLARGKRRETLRDVGWAFVLVGLVLLVVRHVGGNYAVNALVTPGYQPPARHVWLIMTEILGQIGWGIIFYGVVAVLGTALAGPTKVATSVRRWLAPVFETRPGMVWTAVGFAYLLLVVWGGTHALRTWWGIIFLAALLAAGVEALRRQTLSEFPVAGPPPSTGSASPA